MDKKFLLLFPPSWYLLGPHLALPLLNAQLKKANYDVCVRDLNIEFFNDILSEEYFKNVLKKLKEEFLNGNNYVNKEKYENIYFLVNKYGSKFDIFPFLVQKSLSIIKSQNDFYNYDLLNYAVKMIVIALNIISALYYPLQIYFSGRIENPEMDFSYEKIKKNIFDNSSNIFLEYYREKVEEIKRQNLDYIGISVSSVYSLLSGLTLAYMLKKETTAHICIGGQLFSRIIDTIVKTPELFDLFADSFMYGESEKTILQMAKYINGEIPIENVENLIYRQNGEVIVNSCCSREVKLSEIEPADYSDLDFSKYFSPEVIIPISMNKGCYWKKCTFCDISHGKTFSVKDINVLIEEILNYKEKYKTHFFYVIDEAILPEYLDKLSDELIKQKVGVYLMLLVRFEDKFTYSLLSKMKKAGILYVQWGYEAASERIIEKMNKGINPKNRINILRASQEAGIMNHIYSMWDFPSETANEVKRTINELSLSCADIVAFQKFILTKHSCLSENKQEFKILEEEVYEFMPYYQVVNEAITEEERAEIEELADKCLAKSGNLFHYNIFYLARYGLEYLKKLKKHSSEF